jgi:signal peptidase II
MVTSFPPNSVTLLPFLDLIVTNNSGIAFSIFSTSGDFIQLMLILIILCALLFLFNEFRNSRIPIQKNALIFILAGGVGNFIERVYRGAVTDFLHLRIETFSFFIFNLADLFISVGAVVIIFQWIRSQKNT